MMYLMQPEAAAQLGLFSITILASNDYATNIIMEISDHNLASHLTMVIFFVRNIKGTSKDKTNSAVHLSKGLDGAALHSLYQQ